MNKKIQDMGKCYINNPLITTRRNVLMQFSIVNLCLKLVIIVITFIYSDKKLINCLKKSQKLFISYRTIQTLLCIRNVQELRN